MRELENRLEKLPKGKRGKKGSREKVRYRQNKRCIGRHRGPRDLM